MKKLFVLVMLVLISTAAGVGCGDDENSNSGSANNTADTDTGDKSPDAGSDTGDDAGGGAVLVIPTANSGTYGSMTLQGPGASGTFFLTVVAITDHPNLCSTVPDTCDGSTTAEGTVLVLRLLTDEAQKTGRYDLKEFDEDAFTAGSMFAQAQLDNLASGTSSNEVDITEGHVDVTAFDAQHVAGTYELTVHGTVETGTFDVEFCQALSDSLACD